MSPNQTALYLARIRDRIAAIRESTNSNATSFKTIITNTVRRDTLGWRGEAARYTLGVSLHEYYDGPQASEDDLRDLSPVDGDLLGLDQRNEEQDCDVRSDSMEPLGDGEGEGIDEGDEEYYEREDWELDMDRDYERYMSLESLIAEEPFLNEDMVNKTKRCEIQDMLQKYSEEAPNHRQDDEEDIVSNPYPEDDDLIPLARQPNHGSLPTPNYSSNANAKSSSELSILTNPFPEDAPTSQPQPPPPTQSPYPTNRDITPSTHRSPFPIYPSDRTISPITPFIASSHVLFPVSPSSPRSPVQYPSELGAYAHNDVEEREYALNHPYHGMSQQETQQYWQDLQGYNTESEQHLRRGEAPRNRRQRAASSPVQYRNERILGSAGEEYGRRVGDEMEVEQRGQAGEKKKVNMVGRFLNTFTCRPGSVSPDGAAVPVKNDEAVGMVSIVPRKYARAFLSRKNGRTQKKEEDERIHERLLGSQIIPLHDKTTWNAENKRGARREPQSNSQTKIGEGDNRPRSKPRVVNVGSQMQGVIGPPVDLSKMIQRAPESIRTPSPLLGSNVWPSGAGENTEHVSRQAHSESSSSLGDRLRRTRLEDLPLHFGAAEEIRNLMLDLERDQNKQTASPVQQRDELSDGFYATTTLPTGRANELPGGFSRPEDPITPHNPASSPSPRETLQRHFNSQREANKQYAHRVRAAKSHSSNLTLPPNFRAPEIHSSSLSISREPSPLM
ncbi:hypothetical protein ACET3X_007492 [Alternaria dauci]|uniref:Uncharacterized protein n=1 Tax=Alternaria dauci TaxID=48095 RepID=A0ABR3UC40_9PLEO